MEYKSPYKLIFEKGLITILYEILKKWPCEYRYTEKEMKYIQTGKGKDMHVSKDDIARLKSLLPEH